MVYLDAVKECYSHSLLPLGKAHTTKRASDFLGTVEETNLLLGRARGRADLESLANMVNGGIETEQKAEFVGETVRFDAT